MLSTAGSIPNYLRETIAEFVKTEEKNIALNRMLLAMLKSNGRIDFRTEPMPVASRKPDSQTCKTCGSPSISDKECWICGQAYKEPEPDHFWAGTTCATTTGRVPNPGGWPQATTAPAYDPWSPVIVNYQPRTLQYMVSERALRDASLRGPDWQIRLHLQIQHTLEDAGFDLSQPIDKEYDIVRRAMVYSQTTYPAYAKHKDRS